MMNLAMRPQQIQELGKIVVAIETISVNILWCPVGCHHYNHSPLEEHRKQRHQEHAILDCGDGELVKAEHVQSVSNVMRNLLDNIARDGTAIQLLPVKLHLQFVEKVMEVFPLHPQWLCRNGREEKIHEHRFATTNASIQVQAFRLAPVNTMIHGIENFYNSLLFGIARQSPHTNQTLVHRQWSFLAKLGYLVLHRKLQRTNC
mmetsp:Transcript_56230/g.150184  ORF Transcript_56230/g.150184 Transcript_56230/m.150184 type:complete len:203 (+) Transcript_56230:1168-1776(+)